MKNRVTNTTVVELQNSAEQKINEITNVDITKKKISCFISYSKDSKRHVEDVRKLAKRLESEEDFDIKFQEFSKPVKDVQNYMEDSVINSDKILLICTQNYAEEANKSDKLYKKMIITDDLLRLCDITTRKIIPIAFSEGGSKFLPNFLYNKKAIVYDENDKSSYKRYKQIIKAINKKPNAWTLGELLAPHKVKRKKRIRDSFVQTEGDGKRKEKENIRKETIDMIKIFYDRHQYYHTHYWKLVFRVFSVIITLITVPFIMIKYFYAGPFLLSIPPLISVFVTVFLIMGLKSEEAQMHNVELKTNCLMEVMSENYSNFDPTAFSNPKLFWNKLNRHKVANLVLFLLLGLSLVAIIEGVLIASQTIKIDPIDTVRETLDRSYLPLDNAQPPIQRIQLIDSIQQLIQRIDSIQQLIQPKDSVLPDSIYLHGILYLKHENN